MNHITKVGECYRLNVRCPDDAYVAKSMINHLLYSKDDIYVDMDSFIKNDNNHTLIHSKIIIRSQTQTIAYLHKIVKNIIDEVNLSSHDGSLWAFMMSVNDNEVLTRQMKLNTNKNWNHLILTTRQKSILNNYLNCFQNKSWYLNTGVPYKATFLFYGPPGTGKTTLIKVLAEQYKRHVVLFSLKSMKNETFMDMFYDYRFKNNMDRLFMYLKILMLIHVLFGIVHQ